MINFYTDHEEFVSNQIQCNAGTAILGTSAISGLASWFGSRKASEAQTSAANQAYWTNIKNQQNIEQMYAPYRAAGEKALTDLQARMPELTSDINLDEELAKNSTVKQAYDFTNKQGLKAVQNSAAKRGLGVSGAALKGATAFTTGLAKNTYLDLFNMERANRADAYSRLKGLVDTGTTSAQGTTTGITATGKAASDALIQKGNAEAAGIMGQANAVRNAAQDFSGWTYGSSRGLYDGTSGYRPGDPSSVPRTGVNALPIDDVYF